MASIAPIAAGPSPVLLTEWLDAARVGLWAPLSEMLDSGRIDVNAHDEHGLSALMVCAEEGQQECVEQLIQAGAKIDQADASGVNALMYAAESGAVGCMRLLLEAAATRDDADLDLNAQDALGETAALKAARAQETGALRALVEYEEQRCDLEIANEAGDTPLLAAAAAAPDHALDAVQFLLSNERNRSRVNAYNRATGRTPILNAVRDAKLNLLKLLCDTKGADLDRQDNDGTTAVMQCVIDELPLPFLQELLRHGASLSPRNLKGYTALHLAVRDGLTDFVSALLSHSPHASSRDLDAEFGWTPLMHAAAKGQKDIVKLMGEAGVDVNVQDKRGSTALLLASRFGSLICVKFLVKFGASLTLPDRAGHTPLCEAGAGGHLDVVRFLLDKGAPVRAVDARGNNILHQLCARTTLPNAALDVATLVLRGRQDGSDAGADAVPPHTHALLHGLNADGETCWSLARSHSHHALVSLFSQCASLVPPPAPEVLSTSAGDGSIIVAFRPALNATFMLADLTYQATATPILADAEMSGSVDMVAPAEKKVLKKSSTKKPASSAAAAAAGASPPPAAASVVKIAEPKKSASVKKSGATNAVSSSSSSSTGTSLAAAASKKKASSKREVVAARPVAVVVRGMLSPLRLGGLHNGVRYLVSLVAINAAGSSEEARGGPNDAEGVLVGPPPPPIITQVVTGANWASVSFMPGGAPGASNAASTAHTGAGGTGAKGSEGSDADLSVVEEFVLTATASISSSNPRTASAAAPSSSPTSSSTSSSSMDRVVSAVSSPVLLTNLAPGLSYSLAIRARNGYGMGAPSTQGKVFSVSGATMNAASTPAASVSASASSPSSPHSSSSVSAAAEKHVAWLSPSLDAAELAECRSLLTSSLSAELQALLKQARPASAAPSRPSTATTRAQQANRGDSSSMELRIVRAAKIANHALQSAFDSAPSFMQALGCPRAEATRVQSAFVPLERGARGMAQLSAYALHGLLPASHPLSPSFQPAAGAAAAASPSSSSSGVDHISYNYNTFPVGSPYRGIYVALHVGRKMLLASGSGGGGATSPSAEGDDPDGADVQRLLICKVWPGRTRAPYAAAASDAAAVGAAAAAAGRPPSAVAAPALPAHVQSTRFDSHQSPSGSDLFLYSPAQVMPAYFVEFVLPLAALALAPRLVGRGSMSAEEMQRAEEDAQLERDANEQSGLVQSEAAPLRADPLGAERSLSGFSAAKWMAGPAASAADPPGELSAADQAARNAGPASSPSAAYSGRAAPMDDDDIDGDDPARVDINKVQSSLLGPVPAPKATASAKPKPTAAAAPAARRR